MCGVAGVLNYYEKKVEKEEIRSLLEAMPYRGPDDSGIFIDDCVGLGHLRLSILDLTTSGHQPMPSHDQRYWIAFNGEIYNYKELATELRSFGWQFQSGTDTEVILAAFSQWGVACFKKFNGMWALAIWDSLEKTLYCSRDRFGIKPFYYANTGQAFIFASEIKALLTHKEVDAQINYKTLGRFLRFLKKPEDFSTCFASIEQLKPAHYAIIKQGKMVETPYWHLPNPSLQNDQRSVEDLAGQLESIFMDSVALRLRSDVPVGACLSGGIDSSAIVGEIDMRNQQTFKTFSVGYQGAEYDEIPYVKSVIAQNKHISPFYSYPNGEDSIDILRKTTWHFDEPTWNAAAYSWWHVMKLARENDVTVILNGQGADELFGGYPTYYLSFMRQLICSGHMGKFIDELKILQQKYNMSSAAMLKLIVSPMLNQAKSMLGHSTGNQIAQYLSKDFQGLKLDDEQARDENGYLSLKAHLKDDLSWARLPMLLQAEDRFSMAFSLESRVPWLDYRLVEFARQLPDDVILHKSATKILIKQALQDRIPQDIIQRSDKKGYSTPGDTWLAAKFRTEVNEFLGSGIIERQDIFDQHKLKQLLTTRANSKMPKNIWQILSTLMWYEMFFLKTQCPV